ncbi:GNAT family N-acetyltransferase [Ruegeria sp. Alg231-54]|uniref:GNAT family N-acetyltransferase n=1 Tax=Ruegeria sp. Alg231-54 TaxID=1922221 RepID=UPI000D556C3A|nr:GNAT family N-acetyltransferase [Ruegeria sp. Alg231-54]
MDSFIVRKAVLTDAQGISEVLQDIAAAGKRSKRCDVDFAREHYVADPDRIRCSVAVQGEEVLGFQSLKWAVENNPYGAPVGWGVIGTHIRPSAARRGVGRALFHATLLAARESGLPAIDATISATNAEGLAYYSAMGFVDYREHEGAQCKSFCVI